MIVAVRARWQHRLTGLAHQRPDVILRRFCDFDFLLVLRYDSAYLTCSKKLTGSHCKCDYLLSQIEYSCTTRNLPIGAKLFGKFRLLLAFSCVVWTVTKTSHFRANMRHMIPTNGDRGGPTHTCTPSCRSSLLIDFQICSQKNLRHKCYMYVQIGLRVSWLSCWWRHCIFYCY